MHKLNPSSLFSHTLFGQPLDKLIPKDHPKRIILDKLPWDELTKIAKRAYKSDRWKDMPNARVMAGLFIWHCISGDKTYREIKDDFSFNKLCAYACGFRSDDVLREIDHTTLIKFEEHLGEENIMEIKDIIEQASVRKQPPNSQGRHSGDSTVFEANITYPTDTKLMESVRLFLVDGIIKPYSKLAGQKHRTYTRVARKEFLAFARNRQAAKTGIKAIRKKQLQHLRRNIAQAKEVLSALNSKLDDGYIDLDDKKGKKAFRRLKAKLETAELIYEQQRALYQGEKKIDNRIVSFHRPNIRPVFRGKARQKTEFGPKVMFSLMGKALILGKVSYDNFYDGKGYRETIETMRNKGHPVKEAVGDKGNGGLRRFFRKLGIVDGIERRGKQTEPPPIPKKRFAAARSRMEGAIGTFKNVFIKGGLRAKTDFGDTKKICKAAIGYNLNYAF